MSDAPCVETLDNFEHVPPSAQQVFCALFGHEPMTGAQIRDETGLPRRTVYSALKKLREIGVLKEQLSLKDTRQTYFWVDVPLRLA